MAGGEFLRFDLNLERNDVVHVELSGSESDVFLVDFHNLCAFRRGDTYWRHGGHAVRSPVSLPAPGRGRWHLVVRPSPGGRVRASAKVIPG